MREQIPRFIALEQDLAGEKGPFSLFALFLRADAQDRWDLVIAASWIEADRQSALAQVAKRIQAEFRPNELLELSRIVFIDLNNPDLEAINAAIKVEHGAAEVQDQDFFGLSIRHAFIVTSQRRQIEAATAPSY